MHGALSPRRRRWVTAILITALPAVMFLNVWRMGGVSTLADDLIYYLPVRAYIGQQLRAGHLPLWNPYVAMGTPLAGDPQAGLWYPFTLLFVVLPPLAAYCLSIWAHYVLAGWGMYRFLRALGRHWPAAIIGALAFEFCPYLIAHREHLTILEAVAWIPWIFWAWQRYAGVQSGRPGKVTSLTDRTLPGPPLVRGGGMRFALLGSAFWSLQLLVQHIQPSIMTAIVLGAYVLIVLRPHRPRIAWVWPTAMIAGAILAAVQLLPTYYLFKESGRGTAAYYVFIENSWVLSSALTFLFPMLYGNSTPNLWSESWWGISHLSEQWAYPTILVLSLALASLGLIRGSKDSPHSGQGGPSREVLFWWGGCLLALLVALGDATPLSKLLFHIPVYRSLRVPARWILVWSLALPVLASLVIDGISRGGEIADRARRSIRFVALRLLPLLALGALVFMLLAPALAGRFGARFTSSHLRPLMEHLGTAVRWVNPAILWPIVVMALTAVALLRWSQSKKGNRWPLLLFVLLLDLAAVAPFVASDKSTYRAGAILQKPELARAIEQLSPGQDQRLLVPRVDASYSRPLEVLWPQSNLLHKVSTLNGYGPLWDTANRLLLRFMAWGSSDEILSLLRNRPLLQRLGVRFIAVRSADEREIMANAMMPAVAVIHWQEIVGTDRLEPVEWQGALLWPVRVDEPGIYELQLDASPAPNSPSRWFVRLETPDHQQELAPTHKVEPADLSCGARRLRFLFPCKQGVGPALIRIKSEMGVALSAGHARFGRIAESRSTASQPAGLADLAPAFEPRAQLAGNISLYELPGAVPIIWTPARVHSAATMEKAIEQLLDPDVPAAAETAVVEDAAPPERVKPGPRDLEVFRPSPERIEVSIDSTTTQLIVFNESYSRGWRADVDEVAVPIHRANAVAQAVWVPAGRHIVRFRYAQPGLALGGGLSLAGWLILLAALVQTRPRSRRTI